jgi:hypothetical protein
MTATRVCHLCENVVGAQEQCPTCTAAFPHRRDAAMMSVEERVQEFERWIGVLEIDFSLMHQRLEELAGRPIWTHELGRPEQIVAEIRAQQPSTLTEIIAKAGPNSIIVAVDEVHAAGGESE